MKTKMADIKKSLIIMRSFFEIFAIKLTKGT